VTRRAVASGPAKHRSEGIFIAYGPGVQVQAAPLPDLHIEDVAPTALHSMGVAVPADMDGRVLTETFAPGAPASRSAQPGAAMAYWPSAEQPAFDEDEMSAEDEAEIRDRLRALGYFE
ncbi:MAG TPA: hypothetical protein VGD58_32165, partial [Herpetosiphonaceae bacterium]